MKPLHNNPSNLVACVWIFIYLCCIDIVVNLIFSYPSDPRNITPSQMQQYFEYGRSVEGKFDRIVRSTDEESAPIVSSSWLETQKNFFINANDSRNMTRPIVTVYGMSFAGRLADDMAILDSSITLRFRGAPGAVATWSFTACQLDKKVLHSEVVILGVMTDGVSLISTTSGATEFFWFTYPYTYPRYFLVDGKLQHVSPPFMSVEGFREYFYDAAKWDKYLAWLDQHDNYYDPLMFRRTLLDKSSIFRLLRRAYANVTRRAKQADVYNIDGFNVNSEEVKVLEAIIMEFAESARRDKSVPIVYIANNFQTGKSLFTLLEPTLTAHKIMYLSSHVICPPNDPRSYLPDSHFTPSKNRELAQEMVSIVHDALDSPLRTSSRTH